MKKTPPVRHIEINSLITKMTLKTKIIVISRRKFLVFTSLKYIHVTVKRNVIASLRLPFKVLNAAMHIAIKEIFICSELYMKRTYKEKEQ